MRRFERIEHQKRHYDEIWQTLNISRYRRQQHYKNRIFAIKRYVESLPQVPTSILEVGCGMGDLSGELLAYGPVTGIDLSEEGIQIAQGRFPNAEFFAANILEHDFGSRKYDLVVSSEVLEHVDREHKLEFLKRISRVLLPGGHLILTTPNRQLSDEVIQFQMIEDHLSQNELKEMLQVHFDVIHCTSIHRVFPVLGHRMKVFQLIRVALYELLRMRSVLENPFIETTRGLYSAAVCQKRKVHEERWEHRLAS